MKRFKADSYVGISLLGATGKVLGLLYVMDKGPIQDLEHTQFLLTIMAKRASLELERVQQERALQTKNQELQHLNQQLTQTQYALQHTNQHLEAEVEKRTRALLLREEELSASFQQVSRLNQNLSRLNEKLQQREAFLSSIVHQTSVGIAQTDLTGRFTFANEAYQQMVGRSLEVLQQLTILDITHPDDLPRNLPLLDRLVQQGEWFEIEKRYLKPDGSLVWIHNNVSLVAQAEGQPGHIMAVCQNITQKKAAEQALEQAVKEAHLANQRLSLVNEDLDSFVYTASHDLRSPIATMQGLVELIQRRVGNKLDLRDLELVEHLATSMQKLTRTIGDLTDIVKASKDTGQPAEAIRVDELLEEVKEDMTPLLVLSQAYIQAEWEVATIQYPRKVLRSVFYNLLSNALKYRHPHRPARIILKTQTIGKQVHLSVQDNGLGLTPEQVSKLFKMFSRLHSHVEGTGIGLYTIKRMVENYGGSIRVESQLDKGTTFHVYFTPM